MSKTEEFWAGEGGNQYLARNRVDWRKRVPFWKEILDLTGARSVYEIGCNAGWNLSAIEAVVPDDPSIRNITRVWGEDINDSAYMQALAAGIGHNNPSMTFDLTFTAGVLIHIPTEDLGRFMQRVIDRSHDYVLAVEYESASEREITYRGEKGLCWARPYGKFYQDLGLKPVMVADAGPGFDNCTAWLLRK